jgi:hypothetical protein
MDTINQPTWGMKKSTSRKNINVIAAQNFTEKTKVVSVPAKQNDKNECSSHNLMHVTQLMV